MKQSTINKSTQAEETQDIRTHTWVLQRAGAVAQLRFLGLVRHPPALNLQKAQLLTLVLQQHLCVYIHVHMCLSVCGHMHKLHQAQLLALVVLQQHLCASKRECLYG